MKIAFIYDKKNKGLSGYWYVNNSYRFFIQGLPRTSKAQIQIIPFESEIDCSTLREFDVLLFYDIREGKYLNIDKIRKLKIARAPDSHNIDTEWKNLCREFGISFVFNHHTKKYAKKFLGDEIPYYQVIFGISKEIYKNYGKSRKRKILLSGIVNDSKFYILRKKCSDLSFVESVSKDAGFISDKFPNLLNQYQAAIAACSVTSVYKYFELPMCGCLTFMEVNKSNGCESLDFVNEENSIFINEDNYKEKFEKYVRDANNSKWSKIVSAGEKFVLSKYENSLQVDKLIDLIYQYL